MKIIRLLLFNFYTKANLKQADGIFLINKRLKSILSDFVFVMAILLPIIFVWLIIITIIITCAELEESSAFIPIGIGIFMFSIILFLILNKDFFNGQSVSKRKYGYQIVDYKTNQTASEIQCMLRNLTLMIWPLEVLISLIHPNRRIGDIIARTKLIDVNKTDPESIIFDMKQNIKGKNHRKVILLSIFFVVLFDVLAIKL